MSRLIPKSHNMSMLLYHIVCVAKYRRVIFDEQVEEVLREVCLDIALRFESEFLEIGLDEVHVHFLVQSVPIYSPTKIVTVLKSLIAREIFARCPQVKKKLWGGDFWSEGYFVASVGSFESEETVRRYVKQQGHDRNSMPKKRRASALHRTPKVTLSFEYFAARGRDSLLQLGKHSENSMAVRVS